MTDSILREVRAAREEYARSHDFDVFKIVADLAQMKLDGNWQVVRLAPRPAKPAAESIKPGQSLPTTALSG